MNAYKPSTTLLAAISLAAILAATPQVAADPLLDGGEQRLAIGSGIEPSLYLRVGYDYGIEIGAIDRVLHLGAELSLPPTRLNFQNFDQQIHARLVVWSTSGFHIVNTLHLSVGRVETRNFHSYRLAAGDEIALGWYRPSWFVAATAAVESTYLTHIEHTDYYRRVFYEDAVDGWYESSAGRFQFGLEVGGTIADQVDVVFEAKMPLTLRFKGYGGSPVHGGLRVAYRF